ncbi:LLM class F420-dependent oxidoreductase [Antrihabitans stalactiti]|uniref:LLM class F420-dependent oxidoreductase n=1 Tax=Antrihabitans stalactiti TaxID=2584121 RepID=A0A848KKL1_9NOCA|nr:LLM class F420-dependent oxidoreductase [Antrihabitans stalactiti]NMN98396.1 LLM class F420-dependent oxidoreductase [Antrihabitans stalactiti]
MKLGFHLGYWSAAPPEGAHDAFALAESLGYDSVWTAETYGSDCLTPLAWFGASTRTVSLGTNILQMSARTPAATAMAAMTLDHLSGGRFILGLGVSGPQVVEGWYGQPYPRPLARTREYVELVRKIVRREAPVSHDGQFYQLPLQGGSGLGKPLRSMLHPRRSEIPIYLGAEGPKNIALAAEIADGWLPLFYSPRMDDFYRGALEEGFAQPGARHSLDDFEIAATVPIVVDDDIEKAADLVRPNIALYVGGMGAKEANFHNQVFVRMGYEAECERIQQLYLDGRKAEAIASVPLAMVEDIALVGSVEKIRDDLRRWDKTVVTSLLLQGLGYSSIHTVAKLLE